jgi:hypothetical protein
VELEIELDFILEDAPEIRYADLDRPQGTRRFS